MNHSEVICKDKNFFLDGNKLGLGVQIATNFHPVTKMRISGAIPHSSYTPSWCSQRQFYLLSPRTFFGWSALYTVRHKILFFRQPTAIWQLRNVYSRCFTTSCTSHSHTSVYSLTDRGIVPNTTHSNRQQPESQSDYINMGWGAPCPRRTAHRTPNTEVSHVFA